MSTKRKKKPLFANPDAQAEYERASPKRRKQMIGLRLEAMTPASKRFPEAYRHFMDNDHT